jgi:hypothetical protein
MQHAGAKTMMIMAIVFASLADLNKGLSSAIPAMGPVRFVLKVGGSPSLRRDQNSASSQAVRQRRGHEARSDQPLLSLHQV